MNKDANLAPLPVTPWEVCVLFWSALIGFAIVFGDIQPGSIRSQLSTWAALVIGIGLFVGATTAGFGLTMPRRQRVTGMILEQVGIAIMGSAALVYAICAFAAVGGEAVAASGFALSITSASWWWWWKIQDQLRTAQSQATEGSET